MSTTPHIDLHALGERVYRRRRELEIDQKDVADQAGVSREYVSRLETASNRNPKLRDLESVARALGKPLAWLLYGDTQPLTDDELTDDEQAELERLLSDPEWRVEFASLYRDSRVRNWSAADKRFVLNALRAARAHINELRSQASDH